MCVSTQRFLFTRTHEFYASMTMKKSATGAGFLQVGAARQKSSAETTSTFSSNFYYRNRTQATASTRKPTERFCGAPQKRKTPPYNRLTGAIAHRRGAPERRRTK
jgi:hypothetical protein